MASQVVPGPLEYLEAVELEKRRSECVVDARAQPPDDVGLSVERKVCGPIFYEAADPLPVRPGGAVQEAKDRFAHRGWHVVRSLDEIKYRRHGGDRSSASGGDRFPASWQGGVGDAIRTSPEVSRHRAHAQRESFDSF